MNVIFHEFISTLVEIYIDDVVVKSRDFTKQAWSADHDVLGCLIKIGGGADLKLLLVASDSHV